MLELISSFYQKWGLSASHFRMPPTFPTPFYLIAFLGTFVNIIPFFLKFSVCNDSLSSEMLYPGNVHVPSLIHSLFFRDAVVLTIGSVIPIAMFLCCDIITGTLVLASTKCYRLFSIVIPCLLILLSGIPNENIGIVVFAIQTQKLLQICGFLVRSHSCGSSIWKFHPTFLTTVIWSTACCVNAMMPYVCTSIIYYRMIVGMLEAIGLCIYSYYGFKWTMYIYQQHKMKRKINYDEYSCTKNVVLLFVVILINICVKFVPNFKYACPIELIIQNLATLLVIMLHEYVVGRRATKMQVSCFNYSYNIELLFLII